MKNNPNKPRLWLNEDEQTPAEAIFDKVGDSRVNMNPLTDMTVSEQAGILFTDAKTREELLRSLHGKQKD